MQEYELKFNELLAAAGTPVDKLDVARAQMKGAIGEIGMKAIVWLVTNNCFDKRLTTDLRLGSRVYKISIGMEVFKCQSNKKISLG